MTSRVPSTKSEPLCRRRLACNGWQYWYVEKWGKLVPIDLYRQKIRAELH